MGKNTIKATTVIGLIKDGKSVIGSDGQVTMGNSVMKHTSQKSKKNL